MVLCPEVLRCYDQILCQKIVHNRSNRLKVTIILIFNIESIDDCLEKINAYRKARNWRAFGQSFLRIKDLCCYKLYCFISISLWKRPLAPLIMMKGPYGTVIFLHIRIIGCKWNIISHGHYSLSTWVQQVMIISDDIPWSYLYIHRIEIGFTIWNSEPNRCLRVVRM